MNCAAITPHNENYSYRREANNNNTTTSNRVNNNSTTTSTSGERRTSRRLTCLRGESDEHYDEHDPEGKTS